MMIDYYVYGILFTASVFCGFMMGRLTASNEAKRKARDEGFKAGFSRGKYVREMEELE